MNVKIEKIEVKKPARRLLTADWRLERRDGGSSRCGFKSCLVRKNQEPWKSIWSDQRQGFPPWEALLQVELLRGTQDVGRGERNEFCSTSI